MSPFHTYFMSSVNLKQGFILKNIIFNPISGKSFKLFQCSLVVCSICCILKNNGINKNIRTKWVSFVFPSLFVCTKMSMQIFQEGKIISAYQSLQVIFHPVNFLFFFFFLYKCHLQLHLRFDSGV